MMIQEELPILKGLLKYGIAPDYMHTKCNYSVRFGRVPKNEKERIRQAMEKASISSSQQLGDFSDDFIIQNITKSHLNTCKVADENVMDIVRRAQLNPTVANIDPISNCPLNPYIGSEDFQQKFSPIVREVVAFAKNIPGFSDIRHDDKINLLRACVFEVLLIRFSALIDGKSRRLITISGSVIYASIYANIKASNDFVNTLFTFVERINSLNLSDEEMALFTAAIVINPKRQGLREGAKISNIHKRIAHCLQLVMQRERPNNPNLCQDLMSTLNDLWILNGMHSRQTTAKNNISGSGDSSMEVSMNNNNIESSTTTTTNSQFAPHPGYSLMQTCPIRHSSTNTCQWEDKPMAIDESSPTSPTSTFSPDEEMRSPGSADSGCSTDSGCSSESGCSSDSGCSVTSHASDSNARVHGLHTQDHREVITNPGDETAERLRKCHIKRKTNSSEESTFENNKNSQVTWHKPQKDTEKPADSPVLRMCLEAPSSLKMESFHDYYRGQHGPTHPHKKFRPALERLSQQHENLESYSSSSSSQRSSTTPSPSYSCSPSPSSSISSSPSRVSSSPYSSCSSNPSSPANISILAQRLSQPIKKFPKTSTLLQSLTQETKFSSKTLLSDTLHECIMNGQTKIPRQHVLAAPSPSRYDDVRINHNTHSMSSPTHQMNTSPPHTYSSPPPPTHNTHIPPAHSPPSTITPTGLGAQAMSGCGAPSGAISSSASQNYCLQETCDDAQPLNLSTKTPSPPPVMEA